MTVPPAVSETTDKSFDRVFRAEYARVVAIATRVLGDTSRAEDVAQDAFLALHRRHCSDQAWAGGWVCTAAAHMALNVLRSERRRGRREHMAAAAPTRWTRPPRSNAPTTAVCCARRSAGCRNARPRCSCCATAA